MYHPTAPATRLYRVTRPDETWPNPLLGLGAYFTRGGRYNRPHQQTIYASEDPLVAITEAAFYQALDWQRRIALHHFLPVGHPPGLRTLAVVFSEAERNSASVQAKIHRSPASTEPPERPSRPRPKKRETKRPKLSPISLNRCDLSTSDYAVQPLALLSVELPIFSSDGAATGR
jgi:hypothetical protein